MTPFQKTYFDKEERIAREAARLLGPDSGAGKVIAALDVARARGNDVIVFRHGLRYILWYVIPDPYPESD